MDIIDCFATDHGMYIIHWPMYMYYSDHMPYKKEIGIGIKLWNFSYAILHFQKKSLALFKNPYRLVHNCRLCHWYTILCIFICDGNENQTVLRLLFWTGENRKGAMDHGSTWFSPLCGIFYRKRFDKKGRNSFFMKWERGIVKIFGVLSRYLCQIVNNLSISIVTMNFVGFAGLFVTWTLSHSWLYYWSVTHWKHCDNGLRLLLLKNLSCNIGAIRYLLAFCIGNLAMHFFVLPFTTECLSGSLKP